MDDPAGLTGASHDVLRHVGCEAGKDPPVGSAVLARADGCDLLHQPVGHRYPAAGGGRLARTDQKAEHAAATLRGMGFMSLGNALKLVILFAEQDSPKFEPAPFVAGPV
jgi:hypothetical protein